VRGRGSRGRVSAGRERKKGKGGKKAESAQNLVLFVGGGLDALRNSVKRAGKDQKKGKPILPWGKSKKLYGKVTVHKRKLREKNPISGTTRSTDPKERKRSAEEED